MLKKKQILSCVSKPILADFYQNIKIKKSEENDFLWCPVRQKYIVKTPEEFIRQLWIACLVEHGISERRIQVEKQFEALGKNRRFDLLLFDSQHTPFILFEFKSFTQPISDVTASQIALYNLSLKAPYLVLSNGKVHLYGKVDFTDKSFHKLSSFDELLTIIQQDLGIQNR